MGVSHITDVESIILYLYFQINKFVKGFHPLLWSRNQCVCLTKNKINCFEQTGGVRFITSVVRAVLSDRADPPRSCLPLFPSVLTVAWPRSSWMLEPERQVPTLLGFFPTVTGCNNGHDSESSPRWPPSWHVSSRPFPSRQRQSSFVWY